MLEEKISGTHVGLWLLLPEHLRLGTWDLLKAWTGIPDDHALEPRLALQMIHESALCCAGLRQRRTLRQKGFETLNGLPFVATDVAIHRLLNAHTVAESEALQRALGKLRQAQGHYNGKYVLVDPHRIYSWSRRQMPLRKSHQHEAAPRKVAQTFFAIDGESAQPLGFGMGSSAVTITQATLPLVQRIESTFPGEVLFIADTEHCTADILNMFLAHERFSCLMPAVRYKKLLDHCATLRFTPRWPGYAVAESEYQLRDQHKPVRLLVQRTAEREEDFDYKPFMTTSILPTDELMSLLFPQRWKIEEFFNTECSLGWNQVATLNLNIRFGRLSLALIAQAVIYQLRQKLPSVMSNWTTQSIAQKLFKGIDGDIRVKQDTIIVTCYNAPESQSFKEQYEKLPEKLAAQNIDPRVPWLYNFKVDFRFK